MNARNGFFPAILLSAALAVPVVFTIAAHAGPPLICHPINIGDAKSLPWGADAFTKDQSYDASRVVSDTLNLLTPEKPVLVRMETLRRATLYIDRKQAVADELLGRLMARAMDAEAAGKPDAMAWFDAGYLAQCFHQAETSTSFGPGITKGVGSSAIPGYAWVTKAIAIGGSNAEFELAAALMTIDSSVPEYEDHLRKVFAFGVASGSTAEDVLRWMARIKGSSLETLRATYGTANARSRR